MPPRVVQVDTAREWRGGQAQTLLLVEGMVARGWPVAVACPRDGRLWSALPDPVERIALPAGRTLRGFARLAATRGDLFAAQTSHAHSLCAPLRRPLVVHRRVDFAPSGGWKYRRPQATIAVSEAVADVLSRVEAAAISVVFDGVRGLGVAPPAPDGPPVLAVGARVAHKGHAVLAAAARLLPELDIGVAGDGPLQPPGLRYLGPRDDVAALLAAARVFVHPSVEEGFGQAVVEAMLARVPVVVTDAGGLPEVVGDCGLVVPRDDPRALARAIRRALAGDHPSVEAAAERARARFSVDAMVEGTLAVYAAVAAGHALPSPWRGPAGGR
jgi:glycosyltransferase involved in cell wall biosynthesis